LKTFISAALFVSFVTFVARDAVVCVRGMEKGQAA